MEEFWFVCVLHAEKKIYAPSPSQISYQFYWKILWKQRMATTLVFDNSHQAFDTEYKNMT